MQVRIVTDLEELDSLSSDWKCLSDASEFPTICSNYFYLRAWWRAFGLNLSLRVVVISDHQQIRLIAPFYSSPTDNELRLVGDSFGDYANILFARGDKEAVSALMNWLRTEDAWSKLRWKYLPPDSLLLQPFQSAPPSWTPIVRRLCSWSNASKFPATLDVFDNCPYVDLKARPDFRTLLQHDKKYRWRTNWFQKQGKFAYSHLTDLDACLKLLPDYFALHRKEWEARDNGDKSDSSSEKLSKWFDPELEAAASPLPIYPNRKYFECLAEELCPRGMARIDLLSLDERPVAMCIGMEDRGRLYYHKTTYDAEFKNASPGRLLLAHMLRQSIESGLLEFELGIGLHPYKLEFASHVRRSATLVLYRDMIKVAREAFDKLQKVHSGGTHAH